MKIEIGVKSDPIQYRYTYEWLFDLMREQKVRYLQLGSFFELYMLDDSFFKDLRNLAEKKDIEIRSCFTAQVYRSRSSSWRRLCGFQSWFNM